MPRVARGVVRKIDYYPWYEWTEELEWEDDEFEGRHTDTRTKYSRFGALCEGADDSGKNRGSEGTL